LGVQECKEKAVRERPVAKKTRTRKGSCSILERDSLKKDKRSNREDDYQRFLGAGTNSLTDEDYPRNDRGASQNEITATREKEESPRQTSGGKPLVKARKVGTGGISKGKGGVQERKPHTRGNETFRAGVQ